MRTRKTLVSVALAAAAFGATAVTAPAQAAPITQIPPVGVTLSGLVVPGPAVVFVHAVPKNGNWETEFSATTDPGTCGGSAAGMLVRIDYYNPGAMRTGSAIVNPCPNVKVGPQFAKRDTGPGQVFTTASIIGSGYKPNAGQPSLPGLGTFTR